MNHSARRKMLKFLGTFMVVLLPVVLALWFAQIRAMSETRNQLRSFAQLVLNKTELVIQQADLARDMAQLYQGKMCTPAHQKNMLNIIRGRLYISELIYAQGDHFLCSTSMVPPVTYIMPTADYKRTPDVSIYYYRDTPFFAGYRMTYMQRGNYVVVINPLSYSEVMSEDPDLSWGVYDTVTDTFFSTSEGAHIAQLLPLVRGEASTFQLDDRFYTIVHSEKRPIAIIASTSDKRINSIFYHEAAVTIPFGVICSILMLLIWWRTRQEYLSPRRLLKRAIKKRQLRLHYQHLVKKPTKVVSNNLS